MPQPSPLHHSQRCLSLDVLRGLVVTLMVFVNDLASSAAAPSWLKHFPEQGDGMTVADIVFPAFLFIAGMSVPLALAKSQVPGEPRGRTLGKILLRTCSLLLIGVLMVNGETHEPWPRGLWSLCTYAAIFACFPVIPREEGRKRNGLLALSRVGAGALVVLALAYRNAEGQALVLGPLFQTGDTVWLRHSWWGILGLIGWAYLMASLAYLYFGYRREWLLGIAGLLMLAFLASRSDLAGHLASRPWSAWAGPLLNLVKAPFTWLDLHVGLGTTLGPLAGLTVAGACLGSTLSGSSALTTARDRLNWGLLFACGLTVAGLLLDAPHGLNKTQATPAFCLYCAALATLAWLCLHWLVDLRGHPSIFRLIEPAGANPLLAYLLHPFLCLLAGLAGKQVESSLFFYRELSAWPACLGSLLMALFIVQCTGWIARLGYRLKV